MQPAPERFFMTFRFLFARCFAAFGAVALAGCAPAHMAGVAQTTHIEQVANRPIPWEITPPDPYRQAILRGTRSATGEPGLNYWTQETQYALTARVFPVTGLLDGSGSITYTNRSPDTLSRLYLEIAQNFHAPGARRAEAAEVTGGMAIRRVAAQGQELPLGPVPEGPNFQIGGTNMMLTLPQPIAPGETATIDLEWHFNIPQAGAGGRMGRGGDNLLFLAYWYPVMAVYDDVAGWHTEDFTGVSEFYHGFADYDLTVEIPEGWIVSSTGALQNPEEALAPAILDRLEAAWESDSPVQVIGPDDFAEAGTAVTEDGLLRWRFAADNVRDVAFAATKESIWEAGRTSVGDRDGDGEEDFTRINTFYREAAPLWANVTAYQQHAIRYHSRNTGFAYPWSHMTAVEGAEIMGGGMEYPMMTLMGDYAARGDSALYNVTAHELAHMWIPMIVGANERRFSWMDEGFATFHENDARMDYHPGLDHHFPDQQIYVSVARQGREGAIMQPSGYHATSVAFTVASYMKPAAMLAALRAVLGDETFYEATRAFIAEWAYKHPYPWDLFNTFERVSGRDLDWFWRSWYYETWTLDQSIEAVRAEGNETTITVRDKGLAPMPVFLAIELASGEVLGRRIPVTAWLNGATTASFTLATDSPVARVVIDPENLLPDVDGSNNSWPFEEAGE